MHHSLKIFLLGLNSRSPSKKDREQEKEWEWEEKEGWEGKSREEREEKRRTEGTLNWDASGVSTIITNQSEYEIKINLYNGYIYILLPLSH